MRNLDGFAAKATVSWPLTARLSFAVVTQLRPSFQAKSAASFPTVIRWMYLGPI